MHVKERVLKVTGIVVQGRRIHPAAQAGLDCGLGCTAAGRAAVTDRRRGGLRPERGRPRLRRAGAPAVRQTQRQASGRGGRSRHNGNRRRGRNRRGRRHEQHNSKEDRMTTQAATIGGIGTRPQASLEELVDRLMAALFRAEPETAEPVQSIARSVHEARRLRQAGDLEGALAVFAGVDAATAPTKEARWAYAEWADLVRRRSGGGTVLVYSQGAGRAAAPGSQGATARWRWRRSWGCAGRRASSSPSAACGG